MVGISKIKNKGNSIFLNNSASDLGLGTGMIVSENGYILTNWHVAGNKYSNCYITLENGKSYNGSVAWADSDLDLAIVKINAKDLPRKFFDQMGDFAINELGLKGLAWVKANVGFEMSGSIARFVTGDVLEKIKEICDLKEEDALFFVADEYKKACKDAGDIRIELGKRLDLIEKDAYRFCFIVDFPMYELDDNGDLAFCHNPFSMPKGGLEALNTMNPLDITADQYDIVCNGIELSSGAVRNHDPEIMEKAFEIVGYGKDVIEEKFSALYNAFQFGAPPHAGIAPGVDRMIMLLTESETIRDVIAFPMNSKAQDLLMGAPGNVTKAQLEDVHIKLDLPRE